ncbi:hypothetical protein LXL04_025659 [Taraxacum kok-saghyz]
MRRHLLSGMPLIQSHNFWTPGILWCGMKTPPKKILSGKASTTYIGNTLLPGMKFGKDLIRDHERSITTWKAADDPSTGPFKVFMQHNQVDIYRVAPWNGLGYRGIPVENTNPIYSIEFVVTQKDIYYRYQLRGSVIQRIFVNSDGILVHLSWINRTQQWVVYGSAVVDSCTQYGRCGPNGKCFYNKYPLCGCMDGFVPRVPDEWKAGDWSSGCQRETPLDCGSRDGFQKISGVKFPDTRYSKYNVSMSLRECEMACRRNCSCTDYANLDVRNGGSGCLMWFDELTDVGEQDCHEDLYIRLATFNKLPGQSSFNKKNEVLAIVLFIPFVVLLLCAMAYVCKEKKKMPHKKRRGNQIHSLAKDDTDFKMENLDELPFFSKHKIVKATNNFSIDNKIGEGGFGPVYKGVLEDGQIIAVKQLSKTSEQGHDEFRNEVVCIAKLQHRNLVKLLGYCIHGNDKILIYEYMDNKGLDSHLFDETRNSMLNWPQRFGIIQGIARGILYLHQDSCFQIIHRDLKAVNVLLDGEMNSKISDFGLARMFVGQDAMAMTKKVYAVHGRFSTKSDVFSFGVLVLEIVSGKKNRGFSHEGHSDNLLGHAWRHYIEEKSIELVDASIRKSCVISEILRSIHVGLLCVQHHAEDRPTMLAVLLMLTSDGTLPPPTEPAVNLALTSYVILSSVNGVQSSVNGVQEVLQSSFKSPTLHFQYISMVVYPSLVLFSTTIFFFLSRSSAIDTISALQPLKDGSTIVSNGETYELGFFSPGQSHNRYLGIWYKKISTCTVVWVANRETPISDPFGIFEISRKGILVILGNNNTVTWSSNTTKSSVRNAVNPVAQLLDTGNLVVWDEISTKENPIWQSFDYPGNTLLPGMKLGKDLITGRKMYLTSWRSPNDPSIGAYKYSYSNKKADNNTRELGHGMGLFVVNKKEMYYKYELKSSVLQRIVVMWDNIVLQLNYIERTHEWITYRNMVVDSCSRYGTCGAYGMCAHIRSPHCRCMQGFNEKFPDEWNGGDWSTGCRRKKALDCGTGDGFERTSGVKFPDTRRSWYNVSMTLGECEMECRRNCSCTAFANLDIRNGGSGCLIWFGELMDMREYDEDQHIYIRMAISELSGQSSFDKKKRGITMVMSVLSTALLLSAIAYACRKRKKWPYRKGRANTCDERTWKCHVVGHASLQIENLDELPSFSLHEIAIATNFNIDNKIGECGFGPVYKGLLVDEQVVAVKRLSESSIQGVDEFMNEVIVGILKLRNSS